MRALFLGKHKRSAARALEHLVESGFEVVGVVCAEPDDMAVESQRLDLVAERHGLRLASDPDPFDGEVDLVLSFLYPQRILPPLIERALVACLNFHPAPLPDLRGLGGFNVAILEGRETYGVSAHHVAESFDTGDLVEVERFPIDPERETAWSLDLESQERLLGLFRRVVARALAGEELPRTPQGEGRYVTRKEFEALRVVGPDDPRELTARRIRAFWYPPYEGAVAELGGERYTLVDPALLRNLGERLRADGDVP